MHQLQKLMLLLTAAILCEANSLCPTTCACKWKNQMKTVECTHANLISLPSDLPTETQALNITGNNMKVFTKGMFAELGLLNLLVIASSNCNIKQILPFAFTHLRNLIELDLSSNFISTVPSDSFSELVSLKTLKLSNNPITTLENDVFIYLPLLSSLELSRCMINEITPNSFNGISRLSSLKLDENRLTHIPSSVLSQLQTIQSIDLQSNPWKCDCHVADLQTWIGKTSPKTEIVCSSPPTYRGVNLNQVPPDQLTCAPVGVLFQPPQRRVNALIGDSVSIFCQVFSVPEPYIHWEKNGTIITNFKRSLHSPEVLIIPDNTTSMKTSILRLPAINKNDNGDYICMAENRVGQLMTNFTITASPKLSSIILTTAHVAGIGSSLAIASLVVTALLWVLVER